MISVLRKITDWWKSHHDSSPSAFPVGTVNPFTEIPLQDADRLLFNAKSTLNTVDFPNACGSGNRWNRSLRVNARLRMDYEDDDMSYYTVSVMIDGQRCGSIQDCRYLKFQLGGELWSITSAEDCLLLPVGPSRILWDCLTALSEACIRRVDEARARSLRVKSLTQNY